MPALFGHRVVVINTSPSVAPGLYLRSATEPAVGELIDFRIPNRARPYIHQRSRRDGGDWYILKPIAAGPGDRVDTTSGELRINGRFVAPMPPMHDRFGHVLPRWIENRVLRADEFFVFSDRIPNSFDSRCYGPIRRRQIEAVRHAIMTW
jgi:conjugative transfer signal peptidase TraF